MNLAAFSIENRAITYFGIGLIVVGGAFAYLQLGQLEDPEFSVKTAAITTTYPGASAEQVELEITDRLETKLQEMTELKNVYSNSRPGLSIIKVDIKSNYWSDRLPQVWDVLRKKVRTSSRRCRPAPASRKSATISAPCSAFCWPSAATATTTPNWNGTSRTCGRS
jgi:multidrug efflux pump subunit AcrB